jgi:hypothetical protein
LLLYKLIGHLPYFGFESLLVSGSIIGYCRADEYTAMVTVLKNLSTSDKEELVRKVQELVGTTGIEGLTRFIGSQVQREMLLGLLREVMTGSKAGG